MNRQIKNFEALLETSRILGSEASLGHLLETIIDKSTELLEAERASLFLYDRDKNELWSKISHEIKEGDLRFPLEKGIAGDVARTKKKENIPDVTKDRRFNYEIDEKTGFTTKSMLCQPILNTKGDLIGIIQVLNKKGGKTFDENDEELLEALTAHAAASLERASLADELTLKHDELKSAYQELERKKNSLSEVVKREKIMKNLALVFFVVILFFGGSLFI